jgi:hypothetical protein
MHVRQDGIDYYNSGGWVDSKLTYLTVGEEGVQIHEYNEREYDEREKCEHDAAKSGVDDRDSGEERGDDDSAFAGFADDAGLLEDAEYANFGS